MSETYRPLKHTNRKGISTGSNNVCVKDKYAWGCIKQKGIMHACRHAYMYVCICMCFLVCLVVRACIFEILFSKMLIVLNILGIRYSSPSPAGPPPSRLTRAQCNVHLYSPSHCRNYTHLALADHLLIEDDLGRWLFFHFPYFFLFLPPRQVP